MLYSLKKHGYWAHHTYMTYPAICQQTASSMKMTLNSSPPETAMIFSKTP